MRKGELTLGQARGLKRLNFLVFRKVLLNWQSRPGNSPLPGWYEWRASGGFMVVQAPDTQGSTLLGCVRLGVFGVVVGRSAGLFKRDLVAPQVKHGGGVGRKTHWS